MVVISARRFISGGGIQDLVLSEIVDMKLELANQKTELGNLQFVAKQLESSNAAIQVKISQQRFLAVGALVQSSQVLEGEIQDWEESTDIFELENELMQGEIESMQSVLRTLKINQKTKPRRYSRQPYSLHDSCPGALCLETTLEDDASVRSDLSSGGWSFM